MSAREDVLREALALSPEDRAYVIDVLENSLEPERLTGEEFLSELRRRSAAYRAGTTTARSIDEVLADLWRRQDS
jgi:putative addiction module component (TIGR02574 family)